MKRNDLGMEYIYPNHVFTVTDHNSEFYDDRVITIDDLYKCQVGDKFSALPPDAEALTGCYARVVAETYESVLVMICDVEVCSREGEEVPEYFYWIVLPS